jgi:hydrocephalus-inducing protein
VGKVNFGPLLLGGKNKETVRLKNLEDVAIPFSFTKESIKGDPEFADSLVVTPMSGVINPDSDVNIEITFAPKVEK